MDRNHLIDLSKAIIVITGASAGIGRVTALEFGRYGATVVLLARNKESLQKVKDDVEHAGAKDIFIRLMFPMLHILI